MRREPGALKPCKDFRTRPSNKGDMRWRLTTNLRTCRRLKRSGNQHPVEDLLSNKVFLAYELNGKPLPQRHGFPLRAVAEGYYGYDWVKYVYKVTVEKI